MYGSDDVARTGVDRVLHFTPHNGHWTGGDRFVLQEHGSSRLWLCADSLQVDRLVLAGADHAETIFAAIAPGPDRGYAVSEAANGFVPHGRLLGFNAASEIVWTVGGDDLHAIAGIDPFLRLAVDTQFRPIIGWASARPDRNLAKLTTGGAFVWGTGWPRGTE